MHTTLLFIHIATVSFAFGGIIVAALAATIKKYAPAAAKSLLLVSSLIGVGSGGALLLLTPSPASCLKLAAYLALFIVLYVYVELRSRPVTLVH